MIPAKWEFFGQQVGLNERCLDCLCADYEHDCVLRFYHVFIEWKKQKSSDLTWATVIKALHSRTISEYSLAENVLKTLNISDVAYSVDVHDERHPKFKET